MATESRIQKTILNAKVNLIFYVLALVLSFFSRKIFLDSLGTDFIGLVGTLQNLLGFLNLAELGIGAAIGYVLYKPIFDGNQDAINEIISVMGYLYRWIGIIVLAGAIILAFFIPLIFPTKDTGLGIPLVYATYFAFLFSILIGYFINYRQNLLGADQRTYVITTCFQTIQITKIIIQISVAYYTRNPWYWIGIELIFGIIYSCVLNWRISKTYPWLTTKLSEGRNYLKKYPEVVVKTKQLFVHRISAFAQFQSSPLFIYAFVSLQTVVLYTNYTLILDKINILLANLTSSITAGVGNLIAEGNQEKILNIYWQLFAGRIFIVGIVIFGLINFTNPFIVLWLGKQYLLPDYILYLLIFNFFISFNRSASDPFLYGYGLFNDTWAPITETLLFIATATIGGYFLGLTGIILATTVSTGVIIGCWKPYFLFKKGFKIKIRKYWEGWFRYVALIAVLIVLCSLIFNKLISFIGNDSWASLSLNCLTQSIAFTLFLFGAMYLLSHSFREFTKQLIKVRKKQISS